MTITACIFPGQGSQSVGMLAELASAYPVVRETFEIVSRVLNHDVWQVTQEGPKSLLDQTTTTQVVMLAADVAVYRALTQQGFAAPAYMAGHSLGEYAALVCSGALSLADGATLVSRRASLMQQTVPEGLGAMSAIVGLDNGQVEALCHEACNATEVVTPANFNAGGQVVIAGHTPAVARAEALAEAADARLVMRLAVSVPCHCPLLKEASAAFAADLAATPFRVPSMPVISNVDMSVYESADQIRRLLAEQLYKPVRWVQSMEKLRALGVERMVECGPGRVLTGLLKRIDKRMMVSSVNCPETLSEVLGAPETVTA